MTRDKRLLWTLQCLMLLVTGRLFAPGMCLLRLGVRDFGSNFDFVDVTVYTGLGFPAVCWKELSSQYIAISREEQFLDKVFRV